MGNFFSKAEPLNCTFNKVDFNSKLDIIRDTHNVLQFYANLLLLEKLPISLPEYKNFNQITEVSFNVRRKEPIGNLTAFNSKLTTYYDFYKALENLPKEYERPDITSQDRRNKITEIFNTCHVVLKELIDELFMNCETFGKK